MPFYDKLSQSIRRKSTRNKVIDTLLLLKARLNQSIPAKDADSHLLIATWNVRDFDKANRRGMGKRLPESLYYIAEIISRFDLVAVQEVNRLDELNQVLEILGSNWDYIATDVTDPQLGGNGERMTFVYDKRNVCFKHIAGEIVLPASLLVSQVTLEDPDADLLVAGKQFRRTPFVVSFKAGWFEFDICMVHLYYGSDSGAKLQERIEEIDAVSNYLSTRADIGLKQDTALILLGDFNIVSPEHKTMQALLKYDFVVPKTLNFKSNVKNTKYYDQIAFKTKKNLIEFVNRRSDDPLKRNAGCFDLFQAEFSDKQLTSYRSKMDKYRAIIDGDRFKGSVKKFYQEWRTFQVSDHKPVWVRLQVNRSEDYLNALRDS